VLFIIVALDSLLGGLLFLIIRDPKPLAARAQNQPIP
jgi:hypothetical protein